MVDLKQVKALLKLAGITRLEIDFDQKQKVVKTVYIFKGNVGGKELTFQEIKDSLEIPAQERPAG